MGKVTIAFALLSTVVLLVAFGKGMSVIRGGDAMSHFQWAMAALLASLATNFVAMVHASQSDRIIRGLRAELESRPAASSVVRIESTDRA